MENNKKTTIQSFFSNTKLLQTNEEYDEDETVDSLKATTSKSVIDLTSENHDSSLHHDEDSNDSVSAATNSSCLEIINIPNKSNEEAKNASISDDSKKSVLDFFKRSSLCDEKNIDFAVNNENSEDYIECEKCRKKILIWDMPEHSDYHFALEISKLDNPVAANAASNATNIIKKANNSNKRVNSEQNDKITIATTNKKQKKNEQQESNSKKIENYFKKL